MLYSRHLSLFAGLSIIQHLRICALAMLMVLSALLPEQTKAANIDGTPSQWSPIEVDFSGPWASETDDSPNPFLDYRLTVEFIGPSAQSYVVPGFFAGDGQGGGSGNVWRARFSADQSGTWHYRATLRHGNEVAISLDSNAGRALTLPGSSGRFDVAPIQPEASGFLRRGRLQYGQGHYPRFKDGSYWIKSGVDSPENLLAYDGFDGTFDINNDGSLHSYAAHRSDARADDPYFQSTDSGQDSRGITGLFNYLGDIGINSVYFLPMNLGGDGQDTWPFIGSERTPYNKRRYDISKLYQWQLLFRHAQARGVALHIVLSETESANTDWLDDGQLGVERKLYFRELIARFGFVLAATWNLGEEMRLQTDQIRAHADYLRALDWSDKPVAVHTNLDVYSILEQTVGETRFTAASIQYSNATAGDVVERWRRESTQRGQPWVVNMDEQSSGAAANSRDQLRREVLYDVLFSGGHIEWFFGYQPQPLGGDLDAEDFRQRESLLRDTVAARRLLEQHLPFWRMEPADELLSGERGDFGGGEVLAAHGEAYAIYLPASNGNELLWLGQQAGYYAQRWFNPRSGAFEGTERHELSGERWALGQPPSDPGLDWVVVLQSAGNYTQPAPISEPALDVPVSAVVQPTPVIETAPSAMPPAITAPEPPSDKIQVTGIAIAEAETGFISSPVVSDQTAQIAGVSTKQHPPRFTTPSLPWCEAGRTWRHVIDAVDSDGVAPRITALALPAGMQVFSQQSGQIELLWPSCTPGRYRLSLQAVDAQDSAQITRAEFELVVSDTNASKTTPPQIQTLTLPPAHAGRPWHATVQAWDADGSRPSITSPSLPAGMLMTGKAGQLQLSWPNPLEGTWTIEVVARDVFDRGLEVRRVFALVVP